MAIYQNVWIAVSIKVAPRRGVSSVKRKKSALGGDFDERNRSTFFRPTAHIKNEDGAPAENCNGQPIQTGNPFSVPLKLSRARKDFHSGFGSSKANRKRTSESPKQVGFFELALVVFKDKLNAFLGPLSVDSIDNHKTQIWFLVEIFFGPG